MYFDYRVVAIIPARGGSKGIPKKNLALLGGKTLLKWTIDLAKEISEIDKIIVSTDCMDIKNEAISNGAEVIIRPDYLASDDSKIIETLRYMISSFKGEGYFKDLILLLEPTSPLRNKQDLLNCLKYFKNNNVDSVATFSESLTHPSKNWKILDNHPVSYFNNQNAFFPRQALDKSWELNGACYAFQASKLPATGFELLFGESRAVLMPKERSIDINDKYDLSLAETFLKMKRS